ncbi:poly-beta-1,6-N-acetyl-D-glucosamine N-deacetylase PgaB [Acinetobacter johnsonii]|uniref:Poly-beta-1,6-N-acetyl-D-glucosamine N-deacetylase PgaB n=1 Tax=Acinetobacter johnsonii TaxID=40214 RepID=A0AA42U6M5_ACIJO|nr:MULTISPECIES: poly-beta-1,6-N-acetyl-D-glucosamine N-deacetylase PgaB [Acinetobacter]MBC6675703.1 poly-beta-1,6-N-acetyl-D-glucosamine N-deacetylase PgaB [Acinetobacter sp.]MDH1363443.1 poly-beta-1,6-N-acetyl-D-glucosamine N-deacetylase PgaB [Acinetobacter johnsonii]MDH1439196.1 poly-beta-1,6-N-acetyl-D-glucosamine N-deacetylase PgaB [Acinetobacter johnsonii]HAK15457.1 poly-beta-1,6-N-acetyl-D-glucosamine N-deacetylase PgaB [Acinetobacter junii]
MKKFTKILMALSLVGTVYVPMLSHAELQKPRQIKLQDNQFVTLTFHDVRDDVAKRGDRDVYAISTKNLGQYLEWIQREGWHRIRLEDVWLARQGKKILPNKALLLTFDDGALSSYNRVFPLLKQYKTPAVFAIPTSWINGNTKDAYEAYGKGNLMTWPQMREMVASGYAEFVSHSDNMHRGILANPQQNMQPAAITREYLEKQKRYETEAEYQNRVIADLKKSKQTLDRELGINSRAIFWPYGAVTTESEELAAQAGFPMSFSLGSTAPLADSVKTYQRALIMDNPTPEMINQEMLEFLNYVRAPYKQRKSFLRFDLAEMQSANNEQFNQKLGQLLDKVDGLKTSTLILKAVSDSNGDGKIDVAYFPNRQLTMQQDMLNRVVWQSRTRIGNRVYAELPLSLETEQKLDLSVLTADLVKNNTSIEGLMLDTGSMLDCAVRQQKWDTTCEAKVQQVFQIKERTKDQAKYYANISNNYQTALKFKLDQTQLAGLKPLLDYTLDYADFIYVELDPIQQPEVFNAFLEQLKSFDDKEQQYLIASFNVPEPLTKQQVKQLKKNYQQLRSLAIQKVGVNNYSFNQAQSIHQNFYPELSLNSSPLSYRDPFTQKVLEKK